MHSTDPRSLRGEKTFGDELENHSSSLAEASVFMGLKKVEARGSSLVFLSWDRAQNSGFPKHRTCGKGCWKGASPWGRERSFVRVPCVSFAKGRAAHVQCELPWAPAERCYQLQKRSARGHMVVWDLGMLAQQEKGWLISSGTR